MNKLIAILAIGMAGCAFSATQTSKEYVDAQDTELHNEIVGHKEDADNPHGVTADQVGAYTKDEADGKFVSEESDPTVPEWAKSPLPPTAKIESVNGKTGVVELVANDVGAYSKSETDNKIQGAKPGNYSVVSNRAMNAVQEELDPNVPEWAKRVNKPTYNAIEVGARPNDWLPSPAEIGAQPTLVSGTNIKTVNGNSLLGSGNIVIQGGVSNSVDGAARPLPKYLHALDFADSYPDAAAEYYRSRGNGKTDGGCSSVRDGGFLYRNFDYPFDDRAEFVVKMSAGTVPAASSPRGVAEHRFASVGVAQVGTNLTEAIVTSGKPSRCYKWLPGATVDGINENGVVCEINVTGRDPHGYWNNPGGDIHPLAAVRWALDNGTSAEMVATNLAARIYFPSGWTQNFHWMVADERETWIVENGGARQCFVFPAYRLPILTNFSRFPDFDMDEDRQGWERYLLLRSYANITNAWYTNAYRRETNPPWVTDLAEVIDYTNDIYNAWASRPKEYFRGKTNNGIPWWQSVHTSIYDITNRTLRVAVQETDDWYTFQVPSAGGVKVEIDPTVPAWAKESAPVAPSTDDSKSGKAADAKATGDIIAQHTNMNNNVHGGWVRSFEGEDGVIWPMFAAPWSPFFAIGEVGRSGMYIGKNLIFLTENFTRDIHDAMSDESNWEVNFPHKGGTLTVEDDVLPRDSPIVTKILTVTNTAPNLNPEIRITRHNANGTTTNLRIVQTETAPIINHSTGGGDYDIKVPSANGTIALRNSFSLQTMLMDANTNETADCECISTNICKLIQQPVSNLVVECRDIYHDDELDVTFKKVVNGGRVYMKVIAVDEENAQ